VESTGAPAQGVQLQTEEARRAFQEAAVVVHCTTVGLQAEAMAFDVTLLPPRAALVDLVYAGSTGETPLVRSARERGLTAIDGIDVLVQQAIASLEIWLSTSSLGHLAARLREAALA
jgi:shikimate dehydrogenase